ncbi:putative exported amidase [Vibrio ichthyoenteri ATCC 700023]|uniref:Putative exported amidase n=1 Tax=Vibrio ichthyoenteri ATCC 700023 TaxID=870968 RepID=F9S2S0_9VIBR|nr:glucosaminidase domain-containing protein [Vibrio ichthyoenteri]EGU38844.1 putative exported amidase [Vibrio ichthyoenteri ATCC 700023]
MSLLKPIFSTFACCSLLVSSLTLASDQLPRSPDQLRQPYPEIAVKTLHSAPELISLFKQHDYQLDKVASGATLPAYFVENLPDDLNNLPVQQKTSGFIRLLLPTIKAVNNQILTVRHQIEALGNKPQSEWSSSETQWINQLYAAYNVESNNIQDLLLHVDIIPVGMVLAQGIDESGWGTSHFAIKGNSLYGEHLPAHGGKYLTTPGGHVKVAAFDNLYQGTASYMHNLNTTGAYKELWHLRHQLREQNKLTGHELVQALSHYSTRGEAYVDNLRALIKHHQLDSFDNVKLDSQQSLRVRFTH